jgi:threonyl-tRNA synthetase
MKILTIHADFIEFQAKKKAFKNAEEGINEERQRIEECLVIFTAVEKVDEGNPEAVVERYLQEIKNVVQQLSVKNIVLYPYAHLSSNLSSPKIAENIMKDAEKKLAAENKLNVYRAPFGWYKTFNIQTKGHPMSELSREFNVGSADQETNDSTKAAKESDNLVEEVDMDNLLKKMSRVQMTAPRGKNDQKSNVELGKELDLYFVSEIVGSGLPLFTPKGTTIKREIERFVTDEELKRGYLHTSTPIMAKSDLYKVSGHWQHYKDDMFSLNVGGETFALRPMTCPFQFIIYKHKSRSYRDLPIKYAEFADLFRNEKSGELRGLTRVRQFTLADAHVICQPEKLEQEFEEVLDLLKFVMEKLGIKDIWYRFSKWDPENKGGKYIDNPEAWEESQITMKKILDKLGVEYIEKGGEAAFYGPKLDIQYKDIYGKEDTLITLQIDFALPERYDLTYMDKDGKEKRPMVIHRSSSGATERTISYLLEKYQGKLPLWLSPVQVQIVTVIEDVIPFAKEIESELIKNGIRVELDIRSESLGKKIRDAQMSKVNYILTIGEKEVEAKTIAVRDRNNENKFGVSVEDFVAQLKEEVEKKEIK